MGNVWANRLRDYDLSSALEQENALHEIVQQLVLASLSRAKFFSQAAFHGGTCLRILYGTARFSEDLDFVLQLPDRRFEWSSYVTRIERDFAAEDIRVEVAPSGRQDASVKKVFLKTEGEGGVSSLDLPFPRRASRKIRVKLEIDTNPPAGASFETRYITFPITAGITTMDLPSGFGSKSHALLCRPYTKGRDWYDFIWYSSKSVSPKLELLAHALEQQGPWAGQGVSVTPDWYARAMKARIEAMDWNEARADVRRFLPARVQPGLDAWTASLFLERLAAVSETLENGSKRKPSPRGRRSRTR